MCFRAWTFLLVFAAFAAEPPLALHPDNPHYFLFRGKPAVLITSGEHYGAVLNQDFNYVRYLDTLAKDHLNLTPTFVGSYWELAGDKPSFNIAGNTLAPRPERFLAAWARAGGLDRWDLTQWNEALLARLKDFVAEASKRDIVVEVNLFTPMYEDALWQINPMNARNNVNGAGAVKHDEVYSLKDERLTAVQKALAKKVVETVRDFDNVYFEVMNEPYFGGVTMEWHRTIARAIAEAEQGRAPHLISCNVGNGSKRVEDPDPLISIFNFHYSRPPESVALNYGLGKAIGNNETGFDGTADSIYRLQAWDFILAGGGLFNNLDYSFTAGHEDGTFAVPEKQPGGGSVALRQQYRILHDFMDGLDFVRMRPAPEALKRISVSGLRETPAASARVLAEPGKVYAIYVHHASFARSYAVEPGETQVAVTLDLPEGRWEAAWIDTKTGATVKRERFRHAGGERRVVSPEHSEDIALRIRAGR